MIDKPHVAFKSYSLSELFDGIRCASKMYEEESSRGDTVYDEGKSIIPSLDTLPQAMLYRARVVEQYVDEIKARAYLLQQDVYDKDTVEGKIKFHMKEIEGCMSLMEDEVLDSKDYLYWELQMQYHDSSIKVLEFCGESSYLFGRTYG